MARRIGRGVSTWRMLRVKKPTSAYANLVGGRRPASQYATDAPELSPLAMRQTRLLPRTSSLDRLRRSRHVNAATVACATPIAARSRLLGFFFCFIARVSYARRSGAYLPSSTTMSVALLVGLTSFHRGLGSRPRFGARYTDRGRLRCSGWQLTGALVRSLFANTISAGQRTCGQNHAWHGYAGGVRALLRYLALASPG
jgi:hypothetical protein